MYVVTANNHLQVGAKPGVVFGPGEKVDPVQHELPATDVARLVADGVIVPAAQYDAEIKLRAEMAALKAQADVELKKAMVKLEEVAKAGKPKQEK